MSEQDSDEAKRLKALGDEELLLAIATEIADDEGDHLDHVRLAISTLRGRARHRAELDRRKADARKCLGEIVAGGEWVSVCAVLVSGNKVACHATDDLADLAKSLIELLAAHHRATGGTATIEVNERPSGG